MALADVQKALARLCTDDAARAELGSDPTAFARRWGLSAEESDALAREVLEDAVVFAQSLRTKRSHEAARSMPLARKVLGKEFPSLFQRFAEAAPPSTARNPALDAIEFHRWLLRGGVSGLPKRDTHALRYQLTWLIMQHTPRNFLARFLVVPGRERSTPSFAFWWRWRGRLHHRVIL